MSEIKIYCIGDSHVSVFLGYDILTPIWPEQLKSLIPGFEIIRLGPITAYSLCEFNTTVAGREKFEMILKTIPKYSWILISAGEIDCRVHLIKQANLQHKSFNDICTLVVNRYIKYLTGIKEMGYNVCLLMPPPTTYISVSCPDYPTFGTEVQRNKITASFNKMLMKICLEIGIPTIEIFNEAITPSFNTVKKYLWDGVHLSTFALPILIKKLNDITGLKVKLPLYWFAKEKIKKLKRFSTKYISNL